MLRRLPWWLKLVLVVGILVGFVLYFQYVILGLLGLFLFWILIRVVQVQQNRRTNDININITGSTDQPVDRPWVSGGLGTNFYTGSINKKGVDFITGRKRRR